MSHLTNSLALSVLACCGGGLVLAAGPDAEPGAVTPDYPVAPVPFTAVKLEDSFWAPRLETNRKTTVPYDFRKCEETGRIDNFAKAGRLMPGPFKGIPFDDSDVFKVIEGASYSLALSPDPALAEYLDELIAKIAAAQEADGYLYTARTIDPKTQPDFIGPERWTRLGGSHELYNVGHMYEAAVAHYQATGKRALLDVAIRNADLICATFGPGPTQRKDPPGHQEIEIGLVKLFRVTGARKYLDQARFFLDTRGRADGGRRLYGAGLQDHKPVVEQEEPVGHAVRAGYMYAGMADVAALTGNVEYRAAIERLWQNVVSGKLYLTGGVGSRHGGEAFGDNYELPNRSAYNETCAAIANALWNQRLFLLSGDARYVDVLERIIYNGFLSGVSLSGDRFFYPNPLESGAGYERQPWFGCACCPVNVVRFIPSIPGYVYARSGSDVFVNLFVAGSGRVRVGQTEVELRQDTRYPWDGRVRIAVRPEHTVRFALHVRVPGWARGQPLPSDLYRYEDAGAPAWGLSLNGMPASTELTKGYARLDRDWSAGDLVQLDLPMPVRRVVAHPAVGACRDRFAVERGPLVYCAEAADNGGSVLEKVPGPNVRFTTQERPDLLNGVVTVSIIPEGPGAELTAIPYYAWANRGAGEMQVWFPVKEGPIRASHVWGRDTVDACIDGLEPRNSDDHTIPRFTWWDHRGTDEWIEQRFDPPRTLSSCAVYWFEDLPRKGGCAVPAAWRLLWRDGDQWQPVQNRGAYGTAKDGYNRVEFEPVTTRALRLEVKLQPNLSGGILEWQVK